MNANTTQPSESKKTTRQPMAVPQGMDVIHIETHHRSRTTNQVYHDMKKARDYLRDKARHGFRVFAIHYRGTDVWGRPSRIAYITLAKDDHLGCTVDYWTLRSMHRETVKVSATPGHQWATFCYNCIDVHQVRNVGSGLSHWGSRRRTPSDEARIIAMVQAIPETEPITLAEDNNRCGVHSEIVEVLETEDGVVWAVNARGSLAYRVLNVENGQIAKIGRLEDADLVRESARVVWRLQPETVPEAVNDTPSDDLERVLTEMLTASAEQVRAELQEPETSDDFIGYELEANGHVLELEDLIRAKSLALDLMNLNIPHRLEAVYSDRREVVEWFGGDDGFDYSDPSDVPAEDVPAGVSMYLDDGPVEVVAIWEDPNGRRWAEVHLNNVGPSEWWRLEGIQHVNGVWRAWTTCDFRRAMVGRVVWGVA